MPSRSSLEMERRPLRSRRSIDENRRESSGGAGGLDMAGGGAAPAAAVADQWAVVIEAEEMEDREEAGDRDGDGDGMEGWLRRLRFLLLRLLLRLLLMKAVPPTGTMWENRGSGPQILWLTTLLSVK